MAANRKKKPGRKPMHIARTIKVNLGVATSNALDQIMLRYGWNTSQALRAAIDSYPLPKGT